MALRTNRLLRMTGRRAGRTVESLIAFLAEPVQSHLVAEGAFLTGLARALPSR